MKAGVLLAAAGLLGTAAAEHGHRAHDVFHRRGAAAPSDNCITTVITKYGPPKAEETTTISSTSYETVTVQVTSPEVALPTNVVTVYPTPGTYTVPATTIVVTKETTVCDATTTQLPPGSHTYGGVTTVVKTATTVVCPYATTKPSGSTYTSVIETTTYVCPSAGTYTIAPHTTSVSKSTVIVYPTPAPITTGTYVQPEHTVTVTDTDYVYVCPKATGGAPTSKAEPTSEATPTSAEDSKPTGTQEKTPSAPPTNIGGSGDKWAISYSPYTKDGQCKSASAVLIDIAAIKKAGFTTVRIYGTDCDGLPNVGSACKTHGIKMIIGIFIDGSGIAGAKVQLDAIVAWKQWSLVELIVVGNEAIFGGHCSITDLVQFITSCRSAFKVAGYIGSITTTEPVNIWQKDGKALCSVIDVVGANIHAFFNPDVKASQCGDFVKKEMQLLGGICPGKDVFNLESGWPSQGSSNSLAIPGSSEQSIAIKSLLAAVGSKSVVFSYSDDAWKQPGPFGIEQHWGLFKLFG